MFTAENCLHRMYEAPYRLLDPGNAGTIWINRQLAMVCMVSTGVETRTLAQPTKAGLTCSLVLDTDGGDVTVTVTGTYDGSNSDLTFDDAGDRVTLVSIKTGTTYRWDLVDSVGVAEVAAGTIDVHGLTGASAVPDVADLVAISDESADGDPSLAFTVAELFAAAGDLTALAVSPDKADRVLITDEDVAGDPAKSTTVELLLGGLHSVTALGAAPDAADLLLITDESVANDPPKAITVAELFTAAGDATDLAAAPALDDRLLVTDESAVGDPAKSMSVQNLLDARATAVNSTGIGAKNGATVVAVETGVPGHLMKTVLTCTDTPITISDEGGQGQYGGVKVYDFPAGSILFMGAVVDGALTAGVTGTIIDNWDGDVGLGSAVVADHQDVAGLCGAVMQKNDVSAGAADKIGVVKAYTKATALTESGARWLDGQSAAVDLYLNFLIDDDVTHSAGTATFTGTITLFWINLGLLTA